MDLLSGLTLAAPAGLNAYIPLLGAALAQRFGWIELEEPFDALGSWWLIAVIVLLLLVEVVADKVPAVDTANDAVQTVVRPVAGGILAVAASGAVDISPWILAVAGVLITGAVHAVKASARPVVNLSTAGVGGPVVSTIEDVVAAVLTVLALVVPLLAFVAIAALVIWAVLVVRRFRRRWSGAGQS